MDCAKENRESIQQLKKLEYQKWALSREVN